MKKKLFLIPLGIIMSIGTALWGGDKYLYSLAYDQFLEMAVERTGCEGNQCGEHIANAIAMLKEKRLLSENQVMRCLGAHIVEEMDLSPFNQIKNQAVEWIFKTCKSDEITLEDGNIEFYDGTSTHGE